MQGQLGAVKQYSGALDAFKQIIAKEGVWALWKGIQPALVRQASYGSLRYGLYAPIKKAIAPENSGGKDPLWVKLVSGAGSGALASAVANPTGTCMGHSLFAGSVIALRAGRENGCNLILFIVVCPCRPCQSSHAGD